jgi:hypothetical protein
MTSSLPSMAFSGKKSAIDFFKKLPSRIRL